MYGFDLSGRRDRDRYQCGPDGNNGRRLRHALDLALSINDALNRLDSLSVPVADKVSAANDYAAETANNGSDLERLFALIKEHFYPAPDPPDAEAKTSDDCRPSVSITTDNTSVEISNVVATVTCALVPLLGRRTVADEAALALDYADSRLRFSSRALLRGDYNRPYTSITGLRCTLDAYDELRLKIYVSLKTLVGGTDADWRATTTVLEQRDDHRAPDDVIYVLRKRGHLEGLETPAYDALCNAAEAKRIAAAEAAAEAERLLEEARADRESDIALVAACTEEEFDALAAERPDLAQDINDEVRRRLLERERRQSEAEFRFRKECKRTRAARVRKFLWTGDLNGSDYRVVDGKRYGRYSLVENPGRRVLLSHGKIDLGRWVHTPDQTHEVAVITGGRRTVVTARGVSPGVWAESIEVLDDGQWARFERTDDPPR